MSDVYVGSNATRFSSDSALQHYTGVIINTSDETYVSAGDISSANAHVLELSCDWATVADAQRILNELYSLNYRPYDSSGALVNPAAELGDGITIGGIYSGIYAQGVSFSRLMASEVSAPAEKTIDNEYKYEPKQNRVYKRQFADVRASILIEAGRITAEVTRATQAEGTLSSQITQTATEVSAKVSKTGGSSSSFGWTLTDSSWSLMSGNTQVLKADSTGIDVKGKITATSGYIGNESSGFTISASAIYNGISTFGGDGASGVYLGTNGIQLGQNFKVNSSGNVTANSMTLTGTLTIGGSAITAANLYSGASQAAANYGSWNGTTGTVSANSGTWSTGAIGGIAFNNATALDTTVYPTYFTCGTLLARSGISTTGSINTSLNLTVAGNTYARNLYVRYGSTDIRATWKTATVENDYYTWYTWTHYVEGVGWLDICCDLTDHTGSQTLSYLGS